MRTSRPSSCFYLAIIVFTLLPSTLLAWPTFFMRGSRIGYARNIRPIHCTARNEGGVCMFAWDCMKANGTHLGTCIDRFYFGSCCKLRAVVAENEIPDDGEDGGSNVEGPDSASSFTPETDHGSTSGTDSSSVTSDSEAAISSSGTDTADTAIGTDSASSFTPETDHGSMSGADSSSITSDSDATLHPSGADTADTASGTTAVESDNHPALSEQAEAVSSDSDINDGTDISSDASGHGDASESHSVPEAANESESSSALDSMQIAEPAVESDISMTTSSVMTEGGASVDSGSAQDGIALEVDESLSPTETPESSTTQPSESSDDLPSDPEEEPQFVPETKPIEIVDDITGDTDANKDTVTAETAGLENTEGLLQPEAKPEVDPDTEHKETNMQSDSSSSTSEIVENAMADLIEPVKGEDTDQGTVSVPSGGVDMAESELGAVDESESSSSGNTLQQSDMTTESDSSIIITSSMTDDASEGDESHSPTEPPVSSISVPSGSFNGTAIFEIHPEDIVVVIEDDNVPLTSAIADLDNIIDTLQTEALAQSQGQEETDVPIDNSQSTIETSESSMTEAVLTNENQDTSSVSSDDGDTTDSTVVHEVTDESELSSSDDIFQPSKPAAAESDGMDTSSVIIPVGLITDLIGEHGSIISGVDESHSPTGTSDGSAIVQSLSPDDSIADSEKPQTVSETQTVEVAPEVPVVSDDNEMSLTTDNSGFENAESLQPSETKPAGDSSLDHEGTDIQTDSSPSVTETAESSVAVATDLVISEDEDTSVAITDSPDTDNSMVTLVFPDDRENVTTTTVSSFMSLFDNFNYEKQEELIVEALRTVNYKDICGQPVYPSGRIVGGAEASYGQWPWQVSLRQWRSVAFLHKCGAALVNENWVITAAHCVEGIEPDQILLVMGEFDLGTADEPYGHIERSVQMIAMHPKFEPRTFEYDLALLRFSEPVTFQPNIIPICIPDDDYDYLNNTGYVTGWGRLYEDGPLPTMLQKVPVPVIPNDECEEMYKLAGYIEHIPHIFICAGYQLGKQDSCEGDSGGPLVIEHNSRWRLAGVISWGIGCAVPNQPGVYTRISEFRDWINKIIVF